MTASAGTEPEALLARFTRAQQLLTEVSREMVPSHDLPSTLANVMAAMRRLVDFRGGSVCLVADGYVSIAAAHPEVSAEVAAARIPVGDGLAGRIAATGEGIYSPDLDHDERVDPELRRLGSNAGMTSYLGVPLICLGEVIGLLQVDSPNVDAFDDIDRALLEGLANQMASAIAAARQADEQARIDGLKRQFIQLVSHELRTPLAISSGMVGVLQADWAALPAEKVDHLLARTGAALERLHHLIEELLVMSRLASGTLRPGLIHAAVLPMLTRVQREALDPKAVKVDCDPGLHVRTDPELLERAVAALVDNAVRYGGSCVLRASGTRVRVIDHGPGLPRHLAKGGFGPFGRTVEPLPGAGHLGLGLPLAEAIVAELGGTLLLEVVPEGGTVATIHLPG